MNKALLALGLGLLCLAPSFGRSLPGPRSGSRALWDSYDAARKERILADFRRYKAMPEERQKELRERFEGFRKLPDSRKSELRQRWEALRSLSPEKRQALRKPGVRPSRVDPKAGVRASPGKGGGSGRMRGTRPPRMEPRGPRGRQGPSGPGARARGRRS
ncbi:MAG: DUF3106 domain-containing protein [Elusimicrobia bacterium]|nr:DUF3106 domain-containing protein [Elusimicrobiota bacterium]